MWKREEKTLEKRRSKAIQVEMMYLSLIRLESADVRCVCVNYGLVSQKCFLPNCSVLVCVCVCALISLTLIVNRVTWKTERHVNKPLFSLRCLL